MRERKKQRLLTAQRDLSLMTYLEPTSGDHNSHQEHQIQNDGNITRNNEDDKDSTENENYENVNEKCYNQYYLYDDNTLSNTHPSTLQSRNVKIKSGNNQKNNTTETSCRVDDGKESDSKHITRQFSYSKRLNEKDKNQSFDYFHIHKDVPNKKAFVRNNCDDLKVYEKSNRSNDICNPDQTSRSFRENGNSKNIIFKNRIEVVCNQSRNLLNNNDPDNECRVKTTPPDDCHRHYNVYPKVDNIGFNRSRNANIRMNQKIKEKDDLSNSAANKSWKNYKLDSNERKCYASPTTLHSTKKYYHRKNRNDYGLSKIQRFVKYFNELEETAILSDDNEALVDESRQKDDEDNYDNDRQDHEAEQSISNHINNETCINENNNMQVSNKNCESYADKKNNSKYIKNPVSSNQNSSIRRKKKNPIKTEKSCHVIEGDRNEGDEMSTLKGVETAPECIVMVGEKGTVDFYLGPKNSKNDIKDIDPLNNEQIFKKESSILCDTEQFVETTHGIFNRKKRKLLKKSQSLHQTTPPSLKRTKTLPESILKNIKIVKKDNLRNKSFIVNNKSFSFENSKKSTYINRAKELHKKNKNSHFKFGTQSNNHSKIDLKKSNSIKDDKSNHIFLSAPLKIRPASVIGLKSLHELNTQMIEHSDSEKVSPTVSYLMVESMNKSVGNHIAKSRPENGDDKSYEHEITPEAANLLFRDQALLEFEDDEFNEKLQNHKVTVPIYVCLIIIVSYIFTGAMLFRIWEDWDYIASSYFCFITLSTIGFGDIVPGTDMNSWASNVKLVLCTLWLAFGLSLLAMCFNLMQEGVKDKCRMIGKKVGLLKKEDNKT